VLNVVNREVRHIDKRQEKDLRPRTEGGSVEAVDSPSMLDLVRNVRYTVEQDEGDVMLLFRARYQLFQFIDEFVDEGIPFSALTDQRLWTDRLTDYVRAVEKIDEGEPVTGLEARRLADMLQDSAFGSEDRESLYDLVERYEEETGVEDVAAFEIPAAEVTDRVMFMPEGRDAGDMVRKVTSIQRKSVKAYFEGPYAGMDPNRVRVGTIHSAKGREADHVFVATDLTEKVVEQMSAMLDGVVPETGEEFTAATDPVPVLTDNERRVFYVGMSRARERLVLLENLVNGAPTLPISVLLHNERRDDPLDTLLADAQEEAPPVPTREA
jgi:DNA helicase-2/ATP-dependent DNA helicase PcrA